MQYKQYKPHIIMDLYVRTEFDCELATDLTILQQNNADLDKKDCDIVEVFL